MKLLVISHGCVLPVNQAFYAEVERRTGWSLSLVVPAQWSNDYSSVILPQRFEGLRGTIHRIPMWKQGNIPLHLYKSWLNGLFRKESPDAIYVHHEPYGFATIQAYVANEMAGRVPIGFYAAQNIAKQYPWPVAKAERWVLDHSSFCFPVTDGALQVLRGKGYAGQSEVLPLAIDTHMYYRRAEAAAALRQRLGIPAERFVIGFLGRLVKEKGLLSLVQALAQIKNRDWTCVLAGKGNQEAELREEIKQQGLMDRIYLAGYVPHDQAPEWMSLFDVLVLPSETKGNWKEQFGRVLVEANACGTPVIGSTCGEIPFVLQRTGGGIVVPEADPQRLSAALLTMLEQPQLRQSFAKAGLIVVKRDYGQGHLATRFSTLIQTATQLGNA